MGAILEVGMGGSGENKASSSAVEQGVSVIAEAAAADSEVRDPADIELGREWRA